jgi:phosphoserine phosphatase RsbU/P
MENQKILIVDDEPFNIDYLEQELEDSRFILITANNGQEAVELIKKEIPDLILLDIMMPIMDGFQVLAKIKADLITRDIPIIIISAMNDLESVVRGIKMGAEDFLPKPFEPTLLHARISASLEKKRLRDLEKVYLKNLQREMEIGREIQSSFLPAELPRIDGWELAVFFKSAKEVAGDYYDAFLLPNGNLVWLVGDVCDKGVGAALFMTLFRSLIRATAINDLACQNGEMQSIDAHERLQQIVSFTNQYVSSTHADAKFSSLFIALVDLKTGILDYLNCGNEPPILVRNGKELAKLSPNGPVVGILPEAIYIPAKITLQKDDCIVAYTDGVTDALDEKNHSFSYELLLDTLSNAASSNASEILKLLVDRITTHVGRAEQFDDITLMVVRKTS